MHCTGSTCTGYRVHFYFFWGTVYVNIGIFQRRHVGVSRVSTCCFTRLVWYWNWCKILFTQSTGDVKGVKNFRLKRKTSRRQKSRCICFQGLFSMLFWRTSVQLGCTHLPDLKIFKVFKQNE